MMDWNTGTSHTSNLQTKGFQVWASDLSQQLTTTYNFSQANSSTPYSGNEQTVKMHSNTKNKVVSQLLLQNTGQSLNYQPVFQNASASATDVRMPQHLADRGPVSSMPLSSLTVQMQNGTVQNTWPNSNIHVFPAAAFPGSTVNSVQNTPQTLYMAPVIYSNCPQKNYSSIKTSVYPQASSFSKRQLRAKASYKVNGPSTSQACATVPLNPASSHHLKTQQNVSWCIIPSEQNNQNQINGLSSSVVTKKLQQYPSGHVISTPYMVSSHNYGDATQVIPPVTSINPPPPYPAHPAQTSYGHLAQPVANASNENVQNHWSLGLDQNSTEQNMQLCQKPQSEQSARETNEVSSSADCVNEYRAADQSSNESAKSLISVNESICKNTQISAPQATKLLEQEENLPSSSGNLRNIPKARLVMDILNVPDFEKVLRQFKDIEVKHKLYIAVMKNSETSDVSAHNKNPNVSLPSPSNTTQNQTSLLPHDAKQVFKSPSQNAVLNQALSLASKGSHQSHQVPSSRVKEHLYPILKDLLRGTVDEGLLNAYSAEVENNQSGNAAVQENGSFSAHFVPGGDKCENNVKSNEETFRESRKTCPAVLTQEPSKGTKNSLGFQQSTSTNSQSANVSAVSGGSLFHYFKDSRAKILARLTSSTQNPAASSGSSPSSIKTVVKECSEKFQSSAMMYPELLQQSKNTCLQTSEQNVTTKSSRNVSDAASLSLPVAKAAVTTPEVQKPSMTGNSCAVDGACSLEELKASLTLWLKNLPSPVNDIMESTVSLSSNGGKTLQTLENLPNSLTQNNQTTVETNSIATSLESQLDAATSSLLKGSEPQVAIVAPLVQSKESTPMEVQKKNPSILYKMDPIIEESNIHSLQKLISAIPATNRERSTMDTCSASDSPTHQNAAESTDKNGLVKVETNSSNDCFLELKKVKSEVCSGDEISCLNPVSQKCVSSNENDPSLLEPGDTAAVEWNNTVLQISSVCTLVQGDAFYNSQIANIFNTSPLKCVKNDDTSAEHVPQQSEQQQSTPLKGESETKGMALEEDTSLPSQGSLSRAITEKPAKDLPCLEMTQEDKINARNSEEEKNNYLHEGAATSGKMPEQKLSYDDACCIDLTSSDQELTSSDQELSENVDLFSAAVEDSLCTIQKENVQELILMEEDHPQYSTCGESPVMLLNDQLTELLKEYPNGINDLEVRQKTEMKNAIKLTEGEEKTCGQNPGPSDAIDQMKITILDSQQGIVYFPEHIQSSNKLKNNTNEILINSEGKDRLSDDNVSHIETRQLKHIDNTKTTAEPTVVKTENETHCCMQGFMASRYAVKPCSCKLTKDLLLQSKNKLEDKPKGSESYKTDCIQNNSLQMSTLHPVDSASSGDQSNKYFTNTETGTQAKESTLSKVNQELTPSSFLEKLDHHKPKRTNEQEKEVLPLSAGSRALKEETAEIKINDQNYLRENLCSDQTLPHLSTESFKNVTMQSLSEASSYNVRRDEEVSVLKRDSRHHYNAEIKRRKHEKYKIKQDTSETHMIKGPKRLSKGLKRQMAMETNHEVLGIQHSTAMDSTKLGNAGSVSNEHKNLCHSSSLHSEEHFSKQKCEQSNIDTEKNKETKPLEPSESDNSEHPQPDKQIIKEINLDKFVYSKEREKAWKFKRLLLNNRKIPKIHKQRTHSSIPKINSFSKEAVLDVPNRDKWSGRSFSEKATSFGEKINKLTLQKEQKKTYLNRVLFTQTAQESICLKKLEPSPSKSVWRMKSNCVSENMEVSKTSSSSSLQPGKEKKQMLEFKMCPEILFRTSVSEEQVADSKTLPEKDTAPITAVKSKREDWLNYSPAKRRKTVESETQADGHIPLDSALKLLDEAHSRTVKDSKTTFQTYRKMHLEKRSRSLDSSPII